jgi:hypothetical protein
MSNFKIKPISIFDFSLLGQKLKEQPLYKKLIGFFEIYSMPFFSRTGAFTKYYLSRNKILKKISRIGLGGPLTKYRKSSYV